MNFPYISIIIPVYNVEKYLRECLDSILNWSFANWEAILVDDGSLDNSGAICDEYVSIDSRFKVIHKENEGVSVARNTGLDIARGEWCWFVDSDDVIDSNIPIDMSLLKCKDIVMFDVLLYNEGEQRPSQRGDASIEECLEINSFYLKNISWTHPALWYHRKFWDKGGDFVIRFSKGIRLGEDGEFMRKCELLSNNPMKINYTSYYYRQRQGSATHNSEKDKITLDDAFKVLYNIANFIKHYHIVPEEWKTARIATIAKSIPIHAIKSNQWVDSTIVNFKYVIDKYDMMGYNLLTDRTIKLASKMPVLYKMIARFKYKHW